MLRTIATVTLATAAGIGLIAAPAGATATAQHRTPKACLRALDRAEEVMDLAVQGFDLAGQGFTAVSNLDTATLESITVELDGLIPTVGDARLAYDVAAMTCRGV